VRGAHTHAQNLIFGKISSEMPQGFQGHAFTPPQDASNASPCSFSLPAQSYMQYASGPPVGPAEVVVSSFSFKTGPPCAANLVIDVRFLPDPRQLESQHPFLTGRHEVVRDFLRSNMNFDVFFNQLTRSANQVVREMGTRGCPKVLFAVGCTAGKHRSVMVAEALAEWLKENSVGSQVRVCHRDLEKQHDECRQKAYGGGDTGSDTTTGSIDSNLAFDMDMSEDDEDDLSPVPTRTSPKSASPPGEIMGPGPNPVLECTYCPDTMRLDIRDRSISMPCVHVVSNVLGNGLSNLKHLRERRAMAGERPEQLEAVMKMRKILVGGDAPAALSRHSSSL